MELMKQRKEMYRRVIRILFAVCMVIGGLITGSSVLSVQAYTTRTANLDLSGNTSDDSDSKADEGWSYDVKYNTLTLEDGFSISYTGDNLQGPAIRLKADATIILKGKATVVSDTIGIQALGNLTIKSADKEKDTDKDINGYLKISLNKKPVGTSDYCYGIEVQNLAGKDTRKLTVTNNTIVEIDSTSNNLNGADNRVGDIFCSVNVYAKTSETVQGDRIIGAGETYTDKNGNQAIAGGGNLATLEITGRSVVQLRNGNNISVARGFQLSNKEAKGKDGYPLTYEERILLIKGADYDQFLRKDNTENISDTTKGYYNITMMSCGIEADYTRDTTDDKKYSQTYDGTDHSVLFNTDETTLEGLGQKVYPVIVIPDNVTYYESEHSEYLNEKNSDYREKKVVKNTTTYASFHSNVENKFVNATTYSLRYNDSNYFAAFTINQREVTISGLKAKDKTYDGYPDAELDYSDMKVVCVNDGTNETGIVEADMNTDSTSSYPYKDNIVPFAKAYFVTTVKAEGDDDTAINNLDANQTPYYKSKNVAYEGEGTSAQKSVATKSVYIDNEKDTTIEASGVATGITLGDPNYKVVLPAATGDKKSEILLDKDGDDNAAKNNATIYPRSISKSIEDNIITFALNYDTVTWREKGYIEGDDIKVGTFTDISVKTPSRPDNKYELVRNTDYIFNPNTVPVKGVGKHEIIITGQGNYTGTIHPEWNIERAVREITITDPDNRAYDGTAYEIGTGSAPFGYVINDVANAGYETHTIDVTNNLEEGSNLRITYRGTAADGTTYAESEQAPKNAGTYTVKVDIKETTHYAAASKEESYTIYQKTVGLEWHCRGGSVADTEVDPVELVYNGTPNEFFATVTNPVEGENVTVDNVAYNGTAMDGEVYTDSTVAPYKASNGLYSVKATVLSDKNYTLEATKVCPTPCPAHNYSVAQKEVTVAWDVPASKEYTYDAVTHIPEYTVNGLVEGNTCIVDDYTLSGNDVLGAAYTKAGGAVNATAEGSNITIKATKLSNSNYKLPGEAGCSAAYKIVPLDITDLTIGAEDDEKSQIWAAKLSYTGAIQEPKIMWKSADGVKELKNSSADANYTNYAAYPAGKLVEGYHTTSESGSLRALEYNEEKMTITIYGEKNFSGVKTFEWNIDKLESEITITNYQGNNAYPNKFEYAPDRVIPKVEFTYVNEDIRKDIQTGVDPYVSYEYTGVMKNGDKYGVTDAEKKVPPTQAGHYTVKVTLKETDHYKGDDDSKEFDITQKALTLTKDIKAVSREYDGTNAATLDFTYLKSVTDAAGPSWSGTDLDADDITAINTALADMPEGDEGYITYKAEFEAEKDANNNITLPAKDVRLVKDAVTLKNKEAEKTVDISGLAINYDNADLPDIFYNYVIADNGNQTTTTATITQKKLIVSDVTAKDKVYNGRNDVELVIPTGYLTGVIKGEKLSVSLTGEFADYTDTGVLTKAKDVRMVSGKPEAKTVELIYDDNSLSPGDNSTKTTNYTFDIAKSQTTTTATITPATLTIKGLEAKTRAYDGTRAAELVWTDADGAVVPTIDGVCAGDVVTIDTANQTAMPKAEYADADVAYDKHGNMITKTGTITADKYAVKLTYGADELANDYVVDTVVFTGMVTPKPLSGITWSFDAESFEAIPRAVFDEDCGAIGTDVCEPVVKYYLKSDTQFKNPVSEKLIEDENTGEKTYSPIPYMADNEEYVAKVVDVKVGELSGTNNYCPDENDVDLTYSFTFDGEADSPELEITNYPRTAGKAYTVTYGEAFPEPVLSYTNNDIADEDKATKDSHFTYTYTGKALNGDSYTGSTPPVNAGNYVLTVKLEATKHYKEAEAKAGFVIEPRPVTISQGVTVEDKLYNGTDKATLNFKNVVFDDIVYSDSDKLNEAFADDSAEYIRYAANYEQKDVKYKETVSASDGESANAVTSIKVTAGSYSFIYTSDTPAVLYNYTIADEGNISLLYGKINPRPVSVTGVTVKDKTYDGTVNAEISGMNFSGRMQGDELKADVKGVFVKTGDEQGAKDVLITKDGNVGNKKVTLTIGAVTAGNATTNMNNYYIDKSSFQSEAYAKINPVELTSATWSFDENTNLPSVAFNAESGVKASENPGTITVNYYAKDDKEYKNPIKVADLVAGDLYVARIESVSNTNYKVAAKFKNPIYTFAYGTKPVETAATPAVTKAETAAAVQVMNQGLSLTNKSKTLTFKWGAVDGAEGYYVYVATSDGKYGKPVKVTGATSYTYKYKDTKKIYKVRVEAYRTVDGKETVIGKSLELKYAGSGVDAYNATKVKVSKKSIKVKVKKTKSAKAYILVTKRVNNKKTTVKKTGTKAKLQYWSTNTKIASVTKKGKIKGVKKGKCYIYVMAENGKKVRIKVTVN